MELGSRSGGKGSKRKRHMDGFRKNYYLKFLSGKEIAWYSIEIWYLPPVPAEHLFSFLMPPHFHVLCLNMLTRRPMYMYDDISKCHAASFLHNDHRQLKSLLSETTLSLHWSAPSFGHPYSSALTQNQGGILLVIDSFLTSSKHDLLGFSGADTNSVFNLPKKDRQLPDFNSAQLLLYRTEKSRGGEIVYIFMGINSSQFYSRNSKGCKCMKTYITFVITQPNLWVAHVDCS